MARRKRSDDPPTLVDVAVANLRAAGSNPAKASVQAAKALSTVWALAITAEKLDHWPTQADYAEYWRIPERTAQREWAAVRAAFPTEQTPDRLAQRVRATVAGQRLAETPSAAFSVPWAEPSAHDQAAAAF